MVRFFELELAALVNEESSRREFCGFFFFLFLFFFYAIFDCWSVFFRAVVF